MTFTVSLIHDNKCCSLKKRKMFQTKQKLEINKIEHTFLRSLFFVHFTTLFDECEIKLDSVRV